MHTHRLRPLLIALTAAPLALALACTTPAQRGGGDDDDNNDQRGSLTDGEPCSMDRDCVQGLICAAEGAQPVCTIEDDGMDDTVNNDAPDDDPDNNALTETHKIDILFVVDNSGSMCEEQAQLRDNFDLVVEELAAAGADFRLAVVTTDMMDPMESGRFQNVASSEQGPACSIGVDVSHCPTEMGDDPAPLVIDSTDPRYQTDAGDVDIEDVQRDFGCNATVGTRGNGFEMGLEAARVALSPALLETHNSGFLREDALLGVVFVTDENDCSDGGRLDKTNGNICEWEADKLIPEEDYISFFESLKPSPGDLVLAGVIAPDAGLRPGYGDDVLPACVSDLGEGYSGWRYQRVIEAFQHSNISNICADNSFESALEAIGRLFMERLER